MHICQRDVKIVQIQQKPEPGPSIIYAAHAKGFYGHRFHITTYDVRYAMYCTMYVYCLPPATLADL